MYEQQKRIAALEGLVAIATRDLNIYFKVQGSLHPRSIQDIKIVSDDIHPP